MLGLGEAGGVAAGELDVAPQGGLEVREVVRLACFEPDREALRPGARHLGGEVAGDLPRDLAVAAHDADELRVVAILRVEQGTELRCDEPLVREALDHGKRLPASGAAGGRHHDLLVPREDVAGVAQVRQLAEPGEQVS